MMRKLSKIWTRHSADSTDAENYLSRLASAIRDPPLLANMLLLITLGRSVYSVLRTAYVLRLPSQSISKLSKNHGVGPTVTKLWVRCLLATNVSISWQRLALILL